MNKNKVGNNFWGGVTDFFLGGGGGVSPPPPKKKNGPAGNPDSKVDFIFIKGYFTQVASGNLGMAEIIFCGA